VLLFKRILDFQKTEGGARDKRGAKRYAVGAKFPLKAKITLSARDGEGKPLPPTKSLPMDWGGQMLNLSSSGLSIRLHPAAIAVIGEACSVKLELDNKLFELEATVANYRTVQQYVSCGVVLKFPDAYSRKAYMQLMEPVVIGFTLEPTSEKVKQDLPGLIKEQYRGESNTVLSVWRDTSGENPKYFEMLVHDYCIRGSTETPSLNVSFREGGKSGKAAISPDHQAEVRQLFLFIVQNLGKDIPSDVRKFVELFSG
jgi:hypothetical protein